MSKLQLDKLEQKISKLQSNLEKTKSLILNLEGKKRVMENDLGQLEKEADIMRLENFNDQLQAVGVDLKTVDITKVVHLLEENFQVRNDEPRQEENQSKDEVNENTASAAAQHEQLDDPFAFQEPKI